MGLIIDTLIIKRDELFRTVVKHFKFIVTIYEWLSPPVLETLTPAQVREYEKQIVTYTDRLDDFIGQLIAVLSALAAHGYTDSYEGIMTQLDAIAAAVRRMMDDLSTSVTEAVDTPIIHVHQAGANVNIDVNAEVEVKVEGINSDFIGMTVAVADNLSDQVKSSNKDFASMTEAVFKSFSKPSEDIAAALEDFTIWGFGIMFGGIVDYAFGKAVDAAPGLIDKVGDKLTSGVAHALGVEEEFK